jgi:exodeoxyribonuclease VII large subunit
MLAAGIGDLFLAFSRLKEKLQKEGLFDASRKSEVPAFASRIALVTSPTGAAVRDVIRVATRIHAGIEIVIYPVRVQGEGAKDEIAAAIKHINSIGGFDVMILARGGGSIEDLWAFNEEVVARAISESAIPVVSAVGHEVDFTISDFVADARAPTPSAAPTIVLAGYVDASVRLESALGRATRAVGGLVDRYAGIIAGLRSHYGLRGIEGRLYMAIRDLDENLRRAERSLISGLEEVRARLSSAEGKLDALSPLATLDRGYCICFREDTGEVVKYSKQIGIGDALSIRFSQGAATAEVKAVEEGRDG